MPWGSILSFAFKLMDIFLGSWARKNALKMQIYEFMSKFDQGIIENAKLRDEYKELKKRAREDKNK